MNSDEWVKSIDLSERSRRLQIAKQAVSECPSVDVWCKYAELLMGDQGASMDVSSTAELVLASKESASRIATITKGMKQLELWLNSSHRYWPFYVAVLKHEISYEEMVQVYLERLAVPHLAIDATYTDLSTYVSEDSNYEAIMMKASRAVAKTRQFLTERERWELAKPVDYDAYLEWELQRFSANARFDFCEPLFERMLTANPSGNVMLWIRYVRHTWFYHPQNALECVRRALIYFPSDTKIWTLYVRVVCDQCDSEQVLQVIEKARTAGIHIEKTPGLLSTYCAWLTNSKSPSGSGRELRLLVEPVIFSPYVTMDQLATFTQLLSSANEIEIARKAWRKHSVTNCHDSEFWEGWIAFEYSADHDERVPGFTKLWKMYTHHCGIDEHPFVRRQVERVLTVNSCVLEAEKIAVLGETTVWVSHIPNGWNEAKVRNALQVFGTIRSVRYPPNRGFCYVQFESHEAAYKAEREGVKGLQIRLSDKPLKVRPPREHQEDHKEAETKSFPLQKRVRHAENMVMFSGIRDTNDLEYVKQKLASYKDTKLVDPSGEGLEVAFFSDRDAGRALLALNGTTLPSGGMLEASYVQ